jgi:pimeloyl-ACP methyl ester carboxylesterase
MVFGRPMPAVPVPTQLIWSDRDRFLTRTAVDGCADWVTGPYTSHLLPGVTHWIPEEAPGRTAELVLDLVNSQNI